jgi:hypothetical protein
MDRSPNPINDTVGGESPVPDGAKSGTGMLAESATIDDRLRVTRSQLDKARSRITNQKRRHLPGSDGRSTWGRRRRDLIKILSDELERPLREHDRVLVANAASLIVRCEQLHVAIANGTFVDDEQLIRLTNGAARLLNTLGLNKRQPVQSAFVDLLQRGGR